MITTQYTLTHIFKYLKNNDSVKSGRGGKALLSHAGRDLFDLGGLQADLRDLLCAPVDLVETTCLHPYIREQVLAESVPL